MKRTLLHLIAPLLMFSNTQVNAQTFTEQRVFQEAQKHGSGKSVDVFDANADGLPDVLVAAGTNNDKVSLFVNQPGKLLDSARVLVYLDNLIYAKAEDMNADNHIDVIVATPNEVFLLENDGLGNFGAPVSLISSIDAGVYVIKDFDGDNLPDLIWGNDDVLWSKNLGNLNFGASVLLASDFASGSSTASRAIVSLDVEDFDDDNDLDLFTIDASNQSTIDGVILHINNGSNVFSQQAITSSFLKNTIKIGDFNDDSNTDIAYYDVPLGEIVILENDGDNNFSTFISFEPFPSSGLDVNDINGDGYDDLIVDGGRVTINNIYLNDGAGAFDLNESFSGATGPIEAFRVDFNNDGRMDLFTNSLGDHDLIVHRQNGDGSYNSDYYVGNFMENITRLQYLDFDRDGFEDLISVDSRNARMKILVSFNDGRGNYYPRDQVIFDRTDAKTSNDAFITDIDDDGKWDLVYTFDADIILVSNVEEAENSVASLIKDDVGFREYGGNGRILRIADIDNDGDLDIFVNTSLGSIVPQAARWFENQGEQNFTEHILPLINIKFNELVDLNGDLLLDLVITEGVNSSTQDLLVYLFDSQINDFVFEQEVSGIANTSSEIEAADIDNDNDQDIVFSTPIRVYWLENTDGEGTLSTEQTLITGSGASGMIKSADINQDGLSDLVYNTSISFFDLNIAVAINEGNLQFNTLHFDDYIQNSARGNDNFTDILTEDMDADGQLDIVATFGGVTVEPIWFKTSFELPNYVAQQDSLALVGLYNSTAGANWTNNTNWLQEGQLVETWFGVTVEDGRVTQLDLSDDGSEAFVGNGLSGAIPPDIGDLTSLTSLEIYDDDITGSIPAEVGNLVNLTSLIIGFTQLEGAIPASLGQLNSLEEVFLGGNQLSGSIPAELGNLSNLKFLRLWQNQLTGEIPVELGDLANLTNLSLRDNQLTGSIPASLGSINGLEVITVANNQLTGELPQELSNLGSLSLLRVHDNNLTGTVPVSYPSLSTLTDFQIQNNLSLCEPDSQAYIDWTNGLATYENENTCQIAECAIPTNVTLDIVTEQTASLSWSTDAGVTYDYRYAVQGTQNFTEVLDQSISQVMLQGLSTGVDYTFELRTNCGDSQVSSWVTRNFGTVLGQCDAPSNFSIDNVSGTTVDLSWSGYQFADDYSIEYRVLGSNAWTTITGIDQTSYSLTGLLGLQTYQIRVISQCGNQVPGRSNVLTAETGSGPNCGVPTITIGAISGTDVGLSWTSFGTATYELQYRIYGTGMWTTESGLTAASRDFTGSELVALQTYQIRVRTLCPGGGAPTAWSSVMLFTTGGGANCGVPTISVDAISGTDVDLSWTSFGTATYEMQYRIYGSSVWTTESNLLTAGRSFTGTELLGLQTYQVRVRTQCPGGGVPSAWSSVTLFITGGGTNCMIPVPGVDALGTTTADISWTSSTGATYNLLYREYGTTVWTTQTGVGTASIQLTGLTASTRYQFRVRANCGAGSLTPYSSVLNFTTDGAGGRTLDGQQDNETVTEQLDQQEQITLDIYPNPVTTDMLTIRLSKAADQIEMTMHSMEGRLIIPTLNRMGESQYQINTTGLSNGVYVLNISYDGNREIRRVMIRK